VLARRAYRDRARRLDRERESLTTGVVELLCIRSRRMVRTHPREAIVLSRLAIRASRHLNDPEREREALAIAARAGTLAGQFRRALRYLMSAGRLAGSNLRVRAILDVRRIPVLLCLGEYDAARDAAQRALSWFRASGDRNGEIRTRLALARLDRGRRVGQEAG
jgi:hypothetical protein